MESEDNGGGKTPEHQAQEIQGNVQLFVLSPSDLERIGLITRIENGQAILMPVNKDNDLDTSTTLTQIISQKHCVNLSDIVTPESSKLKKAGSSTSTKIATYAAKRSKRKKAVENESGNKEPVATTRLAQSTSSSTENKSAGGSTSSAAVSPIESGVGDTSFGLYSEKVQWVPNLLRKSKKNGGVKEIEPQQNTPQTEKVSKSSVTNTTTNSTAPLESGSPVLCPSTTAKILATSSNRSSFYHGTKTTNRRMLSSFVQFWLTSLEEKGFIRCPLRACNYISLSFPDMLNHYSVCTGGTITSEHMCPFCQFRLKSSECLKIHLALSHGPDAKKPFKATVNKQTKSKPKDEEPPPRLLVRKRGYSKVHKLSWTISLEQKGYIRCLFQNCKYLALTMQDMMKHYGICNGSGSSTYIPCPYCSGEVESKDILKKHIELSHKGETKLKVKNEEKSDNLNRNQQQPTKSKELDSCQLFSTDLPDLSSFTEESVEYILPDIIYDQDTVVRKDGIDISDRMENDTENMLSSYTEHGIFQQLLPEERSACRRENVELFDYECRLMGTNKHVNSSYDSETSNSSSFKSANISKVNIIDTSCMEMSSDATGTKESETYILSTDQSRNCHSGSPNDSLHRQTYCLKSLAGEPGAADGVVNRIELISKNNCKENINQAKNSPRADKEISVIRLVEDNDFNTISGCASDANIYHKKTPSVDVTRQHNKNMLICSKTIVPTGEMDTLTPKKATLTKYTTSPHSQQNYTFEGITDAINVDKDFDLIDESLLNSKDSSGDIMVFAEEYNTMCTKRLTNTNVTESKTDVIQLDDDQSEDSIQFIYDSSVASGLSQHEFPFNIKSISQEPPTKKGKESVGSNTVQLQLVEYEKEENSVDNLYKEMCNKEKSLSDLSNEVKIPKTSTCSKRRKLGTTTEGDDNLNKRVAAAINFGSKLCCKNSCSSGDVLLEDDKLHGCVHSLSDDTRFSDIPEEVESNTIAMKDRMANVPQEVNKTLCTEEMEVAITHESLPDKAVNQTFHLLKEALTRPKGISIPHKVSVTRENLEQTKNIDRAPCSEHKTPKVKMSKVLPGMQSHGCTTDLDRRAEESFVASTTNCNDKPDNTQLDNNKTLQDQEYNLESPKRNRTRKSTGKAPTVNFEQAMSISYLSSEADKFIMEDESLSMYLNNSDEFQAQNLLENNESLTPIGSEHSSDTVMSENPCTKSLLNATRKSEGKNSVSREAMNDSMHIETVQNTNQRFFINSNFNEETTKKVTLDNNSNSQETAENKVLKIATENDITHIQSNKEQSAQGSFNGDIVQVVHSRDGTMEEYSNNCHLSPQIQVDATGDSHNKMSMATSGILENTASAPLHSKKENKEILTNNESSTTTDFSTLDKEVAVHKDSTFKINLHKNSTVSKCKEDSFATQKSGSILRHALENLTASPCLEICPYTCGGKDNVAGADGSELSGKISSHDLSKDDVPFHNTKPSYNEKQLDINSKQSNTDNLTSTLAECSVKSSTSEAVEDSNLASDNNFELNYGKKKPMGKVEPFQSSQTTDTAASDALKDFDSISCMESKTNKTVTCGSNSFTSEISLAIVSPINMVNDFDANFHEGRAENSNTLASAHNELDDVAYKRVNATTSKIITVDKKSQTHSKSLADSAGMTDGTSGYIEEGSPGTSLQSTTEDNSNSAFVTSVKCSGTSDNTKPFVSREPFRERKSKEGKTMEAPVRKLKITELSDLNATNGEQEKGQIDSVKFTSSTESGMDKKSEQKLNSPTEKCIYNTRHKGTLRPVLKLEESHGLYSSLFGRGRGRSRGRGRGMAEVVEKTASQIYTLPVSDSRTEKDVSDERRRKTRSIDKTEIQLYTSSVHSSQVAEGLLRGVDMSTEGTAHQDSRMNITQKGNAEINVHQDCTSPTPGTHLGKQIVTDIKDRRRGNGRRKAMLTDESVPQIYTSPMSSSQIGNKVFSKGSGRGIGSRTRKWMATDEIIAQGCTSPQNVNQVIGIDLSTKESETPDAVSPLSNSLKREVPERGARGRRRSEGENMLMGTGETQNENAESQVNSSPTNEREIQKIELVIQTTPMQETVSPISSNRITEKTVGGIGKTSDQVGTQDNSSPKISNKLTDKVERIIEKTKNESVLLDGVSSMGTCQMQKEVVKRIEMAPEEIENQNNASVMSCSQIKEQSVGGTEMVLQETVSQNVASPISGNQIKETAVKEIGMVPGKNLTQINSSLVSSIKKGKEVKRQGKGREQPKGRKMPLIKKMVNQRDTSTLSSNHFRKEAVREVVVTPEELPIQDNASSEMIRNQTREETLGIVIEQVATQDNDSTNSCIQVNGHIVRDIEKIREETSTQHNSSQTSINVTKVEAMGIRTGEVKTQESKPQDKASLISKNELREQIVRVGGMTPENSKNQVYTSENDDQKLVEGIGVSTEITATTNDISKASAALKRDIARERQRNTERRMIMETEKSEIQDDDSLLDSNQMSLEAVITDELASRGNASQISSNQTREETFGICTKITKTLDNVSTKSCIQIKDQVARSIEMTAEESLTPHNGLKVSIDKLSEETVDITTEDIKTQQTKSHNNVSPIRKGDITEKVGMSSEITITLAYESPKTCEQIRKEIGKDGMSRGKERRNSVPTNETASLDSTSPMTLSQKGQKVLPEKSANEGVSPMNTSQGGRGWRRRGRYNGSKIAQTIDETTNQICASSLSSSEIIQEAGRETDLGTEEIASQNNASKMSCSQRREETFGIATREISEDNTSTKSCVQIKDEVVRSIEMIRGENLTQDAGLQVSKDQIRKEAVGIKNDKTIIQQTITHDNVSLIMSDAVKEKVESEVGMAPETTVTQNSASPVNGDKIRKEIAKEERIRGKRIREPMSTNKTTSQDSTSSMKRSQKGQEILRGIEVSTEEKATEEGVSPMNTTETGSGRRRRTKMARTMEKTVNQICASPLSSSEKSQEAVREMDLGTEELSCQDNASQLSTNQTREETFGMSTKITKTLDNASTKSCIQIKDQVVRSTEVSTKENLTRDTGLQVSRDQIAEEAVEITKETATQQTLAGKYFSPTREKEIREKVVKEVGMRQETTVTQECASSMSVSQIREITKGDRYRGIRRRNTMPTDESISQQCTSPINVNQMGQEVLSNLEVSTEKTSTQEGFLRMTNSQRGRGGRGRGKGKARKMPLTTKETANHISASPLNSSEISQEAVREICVGTEELAYQDNASKTSCNRSREGTFGTKVDETTTQDNVSTKSCIQIKDQKVRSIEMTTQKTVIQDNGSKMTINQMRDERMGIVIAETTTQLPIACDPVSPISDVQRRKEIVKNERGRVKQRRMSIPANEISSEIKDKREKVKGRKNIMRTDGIVTESYTSLIEESKVGQEVLRGIEVSTEKISIQDNVSPMRTSQNVEETMEGGRGRRRSSSSKGKSKVVATEVIPTQSDTSPLNINQIKWEAVTGTGMTSRELVTKDNTLQMTLNQMRKKAVRLIGKAEEEIASLDVDRPLNCSTPTESVTRGIAMVTEENALLLNVSPVTSIRRANEIVRGGRGRVRGRGRKVNMATEENTNQSDVTRMNSKKMKEAITTKENVTKEIIIQDSATTINSDIIRENVVTPAAQETATPNNASVLCTSLRGKRSVRGGKGRGKCKGSIVPTATEDFANHGNVSLKSSSPVQMAVKRGGKNIRTYSGKRMPMIREEAINHGSGLLVCSSQTKEEFEGNAAQDNTPQEIGQVAVMRLGLATKETPKQSSPFAVSGCQKGEEAVVTNEILIHLDATAGNNSQMGKEEVSGGRVMGTELAEVTQESVIKDTASTMFFNKTEVEVRSKLDTGTENTASVSDSSTFNNKQIREEIGIVTDEFVIKDETSPMARKEGVESMGMAVEETSTVGGGSTLSSSQRGNEIVTGVRVRGSGKGKREPMPNEDSTTQDTVCPLSYQNSRQEAGRRKRKLQNLSTGSPTQNMQDVNISDNCTEYNNFVPPLKRKRERSKINYSEIEEEVEPSDCVLDEKTRELVPVVSDTSNNFKDSNSSTFGMKGRKRGRSLKYQLHPEIEEENMTEKESNVGSKSETLQLGTASGMSDNECTDNNDSMLSNHKVNTDENNAVSDTSESEVPAKKRKGIFSGRARGRGRGKGFARGRGKRRRGGRGGFGRYASAGEQQLNEDIVECEVKCASCSEITTNLLFDEHNFSKHNGIAWREGQEPINMEDEKSLERILFRVQKLGKKWFVCEKCDVQKKSVVGFISHMRFCQKTPEEREAMKECCPFCERYMIPASMKVHLQMHKSEQEHQKFQEDFLIQDSAGKRKRAAAEKATSRLQEFMQGTEDEEPKSANIMDEIYLKLGGRKPISAVVGRWRTKIMQEGKVKCKNPGCNFESSEANEFSEHYVECPFAPIKGYVCTLCEYHCNEEAEMLEHLKEHETAPAADESDSGLDDDDDEYECRNVTKLTPKQERARSKRFKTANKMKFLAKEASGNVVGDRVYGPALRWTAKFQAENYKEGLFPIYNTSLEDWVVVQGADVCNYLPSAKESMKMNQVLMKKEVTDPKNLSLEWKTYNLFEAEVVNDALTMFVGGPVWAMSWCPISFKLLLNDELPCKKQYLAIYCHRDLDDQYIVSKTYTGPGLIQIWCFDSIYNLKPLSAPSLALAIAHDYGAIWCMEWCPSGCYEALPCETEDKHLRRLGLLACACSDGNIHIFSICHPEELKDFESDGYPIFKTEPVLTLLLESESDIRLPDTDWQCLRVCWSKINGHRIIAGSFSNGIVALWNIETSSKLLTRQCGKRKLIYPYHTFQPHGGPVTALSLNPLNERYLMTGSYDRTCKFWDIHNTTGPITSTFKGMVTDGVWLTHWPAALIAYDDVFGRSHTNSTLTPVRSFGYHLYPLLAQNSVVWSVSFSDWVNAAAQGTSAGELSAIFSHQLLIAVDTEKGMKNKRMVFTYAEFIDLRENNSVESINNEKTQHNSENIESSNNNRDLRENNSKESLNNENTQNISENIDSSNNRALQENNSTESINNENTQHNPENIVSPNRENNTIGHQIARQDQTCIDNEVDRNMKTANEIGIINTKNSCDCTEEESNVTLPNDSECEKMFLAGDNLPEETCSSNKDSYLSISVSKTNISNKEVTLGSKNGNTSLEGSNCVNDTTSDLRELQKKHQASEDVICNSFSSIRDCDTDTLMCDDSQTFYSSRVNSPMSYQSSEVDIQCNKELQAEQSDLHSKETTNHKFGLYPRTYSDIRKNFGIVLCDFPTNKLSEMPHEARTWTRQSDQMRTFPTEMYPLLSINRVAWNPNSTSFLWLASGYQCGLVRMKCIQGIHNADVEKNMKRIKETYR